MRRDNFKRKLASGLQELNLAYSDRQLDQLYEYMVFLLSENEKYNLTGITDPEEVISKHFLDSLVLLTLIDIKDDRLLDMGTGAGFPGMVLKIFLPHNYIILVDSLQKRINFLKQLAAKLQVEKIAQLHARAEEIGCQQEYREQFGLVVSRAVAPLNILSEYTLPFVKVGGILALFKGADYQAELDEGKKAISILGGSIKKVHEVKIPGLEGERNIIFVEKIKATPDKYPRRAGIPKKRPL